MKRNIVRLVAVAVLLVGASTTQLYAATSPLPVPPPCSGLHGK